MIGIVATILTTSSIIPQLIKTYRLKKVDHLSLVQMIALYCGIWCWLIYGITIQNGTIITANMISVIFQTLLIGMKLKYGKAKND